MSLLSNKPVLFGIVGLLVALKFGVQPVIEWQNDKAATLKRQQRQLEKGLQLLANQQQLQQQLMLAKKNRELLTKDILGKEPDQNAFKLRVQRSIEGLIDKHQLKVRNTNWLLPTFDGVSEEHRIEISFAGDNKNLIGFLLDVEQVEPKLAVLEMSSAMSKMRPAAQKLGSFNGRLVLAAWRASEDKVAG